MTVCHFKPKQESIYRKLNIQYSVTALHCGLQAEIFASQPFTITMATHRSSDTVVILLVQNRESTEKQSIIDFEALTAKFDFYCFRSFTSSFPSAL